MLTNLISPNFQCWEAKGGNRAAVTRGEVLSLQYYPTYWTSGPGAWRQVTCSRSHRHSKWQSWRRPVGDLCCCRPPTICSTFRLLFGRILPLSHWIWVGCLFMRVPFPPPAKRCTAQGGPAGRPSLSLQVSILSLQFFSKLSFCFCYWFLFLAIIFSVLPAVTRSVGLLGRSVCTLSPRPHGSFSGMQPDLEAARTLTASARFEPC